MTKGGRRDDQGRTEVLPRDYQGITSVHLNDFEEIDKKSHKRGRKNELK